MNKSCFDRAPNKLLAGEGLVPAENARDRVVQAFCKTMGVSNLKKCNHGVMLQEKAESLLKNDCVLRFGDINASEETVFFPEQNVLTCEEKIQRIAENRINAYIKNLSKFKKIFLKFKFWREILFGSKFFKNKIIHQVINVIDEKIKVLGPTTCQNRKT